MITEPSPLNIVADNRRSAQKGKFFPDIREGQFKQFFNKIISSKVYEFTFDWPIISVLDMFGEKTLESSDPTRKHLHYSTPLIQQSIHLIELASWNEPA